MISDASSGPQHFNEVNGNGYCYLYSALVPADGGKKKRAMVEPQQKQRSSVLDDTASSHRLTNSKACSLPPALLYLSLILSFFRLDIFV